jgi:hypothetical protein
LVTIIASGKNDGRGGIEALETKRMLNIKANQYNVDSVVIRKFIRELAA